MQISPISPVKVSFNGWTPRKNENKKQIDLIKNVVEDASIKRIAISGHNNPDADSIGACFAAAYLLNKKTGQMIDVYIFGRVPKKFKYLQDNNVMNVIELEKDPQYLRIPPKQYDLAVSVDTSDINLMDRDYYRDVFKPARKTIKIDHHKLPEIMNNNLQKRMIYADINFTDSSCPSASEIIMQLTKPLGLLPSELPAGFNNSIYTGILGDTGNFNYATNTMPFYDTVLLVKNGLNPEKVARRMNAKLSKEGLQVMAMVRERVKFKGNVAALYIDNDVQKAIDNIQDDDMRYEVQNRIKTYSANLRNIEDIEVSLLITPRENNCLYVSARSNHINVRKIALAHNGGGHDKASGFIVRAEKKDEYVINDVIKEFQKQVNARKEQIQTAAEKKKSFDKKF